MKDMIILAMYVDIGNLGAEETSEYMTNIAKSVSMNKEDNIKFFFIPTKDKTGIECVYPKYVVKEDMEEDHEEMMVRLENAIQKYEDAAKQISDNNTRV